MHAVTLTINGKSHVLKESQLFELTREQFTSLCTPLSEEAKVKKEGKEIADEGLILLEMEQPDNWARFVARLPSARALKRNYC